MPEPGTEPMLPEPDRACLRGRLLAWYEAHARELPWRGAPTPYETLVSEVMLQQTRVDTVIPYFERWLARFPDVRSLAAAEEDDVLRAWEGLGYYSRARNLHGAARMIRERFAGELPDDLASLRELPGVGDYTAGAVASIAFGRVEPAVDGNVKRVLARVYDLEAPTAAELRARATALVDPERPGDFNQALMELGATVCTPRAPACPDCPLDDVCLARARGTVALRPAPARRAAIPGFELVTVVLIDRDGRLLLRRRPPRGLLAGMWEFPSAPMGIDEEPADQALALARALTGRPLVDGRVLPLRPVRHTFSHRHETYHAFVVATGERTPAPAGESASSEETSPAGKTDAPDGRCAWISRSDLSAHALPRAQRRLQAAALNRLPHTGAAIARSAG